MSRLKRLGERLSARDLARQVAEVQIRCAIVNTFGALEIPDTVARARSKREREKCPLNLIYATASA